MAIRPQKAGLMREQVSHYAAITRRNEQAAALPRSNQTGATLFG